MRQFHGIPHGTFRRDERVADDGESVRFTLELTDRNGTESVDCRVSREALEDVTRSRSPLSSADMVAAAQRYRDAIHAAIDRKLKLWQFDQDDRLWVYTADLQP